MAKGQKRSNREIRKPKQEKAPARACRVQLASPHPPRSARHPPHQGEGVAPGSPISSPSMGEVARRAGGGANAIKRDTL